MSKINYILLILFLDLSICYSFEEKKQYMKIFMEKIKKLKGNMILKVKRSWYPTYNLAKLYLIGNKCDLISERQVSEGIDEFISDLSNEIIKYLNN